MVVVDVHLFQLTGNYDFFFERNSHQFIGQSVENIDTFGVDFSIDDSQLLAFLIFVESRKIFYTLNNYRHLLDHSCNNFLVFLDYFDHFLFLVIVSQN